METELSLARELNRKLRASGLTVAVAEGTSGGRLGERLARYPGATAYFKGSVVTYDYASRANVLGIDESLLQRNGAVSENAVRAMATTVRDLFAANIGLASSGVAGPSGQNVGLLWLALATEREVIVRQHQFPNASRLSMQRSFATSALHLLRDAVADYGR